MEWLKTKRIKEIPRSYLMMNEDIQQMMMAAHFLCMLSFQSERYGKEEEYTRATDNLWHIIGVYNEKHGGRKF
jgi:hypothetical protein